MFHADDIERDELRAEAAAERRRLRPHFCMECLGHTGPNSPCYVEPETEAEED
jgi:hypothetical protein